MDGAQFDKILIVQTAFAGDVVLAIPLIQVLKKYYPGAAIDFIAVPGTAPLLANHPDLNETIIFDKREKDRGISGFCRMVKTLRERRYDVAFVPHRSVRSAALVRFADIPRRIGFDKSSGRLFFTELVRYRQSRHEIDRNLSLLSAVGIVFEGCEYPRLYPSFQDKKKVDLFLSDNGIQSTHSLIAVAPGSVWPTKRWLKESYSLLINKLARKGYGIALIGGKDDEILCDEIKRDASSDFIYQAAGKMTLLQSAEIISRCRTLVCNDSAPLHLGVAVGTPVVAVFGATSPEFGFSPYGESGIVVQREGLKCKPCTIHGGEKCPVKTFDCMKGISVDMVAEEVLRIISRRNKIPGKP